MSAVLSSALQLDAASRPTIVELRDALEAEALLPVAEGSHDGCWVSLRRGFGDGRLYTTSVVTSSSVGSATKSRLMAKYFSDPTSSGGARSFVNHQSLQSAKTTEDPDGYFWARVVCHNSNY